MLFKHISKGRDCPECKSRETFRVKRAGMALKFVCNLTNLRPHWCSNCDTFFLAPRQDRAARTPETGDLRVSDRKTTGANPAEHSHLAH